MMSLLAALTMVTVMANTGPATAAEKSEPNLPTESSMDSQDQDGSQTIRAYIVVRGRKYKVGHITSNWDIDLYYNAYRFQWRETVYSGNWTSAGTTVSCKRSGNRSCGTLSTSSEVDKYSQRRTKYFSVRPGGSANNHLELSFSGRMTSTAGAVLNGSAWMKSPDFYCNSSREQCYFDN